MTKKQAKKVNKQGKQSKPPRKKAGKAKARKKQRDADQQVIRAAGGLVWRRVPADDGGHSAVEVLVVHRTRYQDCSLPKGKLDPGEKHKAAALREVREETGVSCGLGQKLCNLTYDTPLGPKRVKWWAMTPVDASAADCSSLRPDDPAEIQRVEWLGYSDAWQQLTYGTDREVLATFAEKVLGYRRPGDRGRRT